MRFFGVVSPRSPGSFRVAHRGFGWSVIGLWRTRSAHLHRPWRAAAGENSPATLSSFFRTLPPLQARPRRGVEDGVGVEAVDAIEVGKVAGLAEVLDTQRACPVPRHSAQPRQGGETG